MKAEEDPGIKALLEAQTPVVTFVGKTSESQVKNVMNVSLVTAACIAKDGPRKLTAMWLSNSSGVVSSRVPRVVIPAALHRPSMRPNSSTVRVTDRRACCGSAISVCTNRTSPPRVSSSAANRLPASSRRPVTTTWAPSRTAARAAAPPTTLRAAVDQHDFSVEQAAHGRPFDSCRWCGGRRQTCLPRKRCHSDRSDRGCACWNSGVRVWALSGCCC